MKFSCFIVARYGEFYVDHTLNDSSVSAVQFTAEKSEFKCFCSTTSNLAQNFTPDILILENSADELNVIKVK